jgi:hypothetical protein
MHLMFGHMVNIIIFRYQFFNDFSPNCHVLLVGVCLWEMFSYGFQPWAALTGQQILEAIDEPRFERLEQVKIFFLGNVVRSPIIL